MKVNKLIITIIIILILTMFGQLIYFRIKEKSDNENLTNQTESETPNVEIYRIREFLATYTGELDDEEIKEMLNLFVVKTIPQIQKYTNYSTTTQIENYYYSNKEEINKMGIENVEDLLLISEEINNIIRDNATALVDVRVNAVANPNSKVGYYTFELILNCSNSKKMSFICDLALNKSQENAILYHSNSELANIYKNQNITADIRNSIDLINNFINNIKTLCRNNELTGTSKQAQYYDLNTASINQMGIFSSEDMQSIILKYSNNISWRKNEQLSYYEIDVNSLKENEYYNTYKISFIYDYIEQVDLTIEFSTKENVTPSVKITNSNV